MIAERDFRGRRRGSQSFPQQYRGRIAHEGWFGFFVSMEKMHRVPSVPDSRLIPEHFIMLLQGLSLIGRVRIRTKLKRRACFGLKQGQLLVYTPLDYEILFIGTIDICGGEP